VNDALAIDAPHQADRLGLEQAGALALFGMAGAVQFSIAAAQILLALALICWITLLIIRRERVEAPSFLWPLLAYGAATLVSAALSPDPMPEQGVFTRSDHYQFVRQGVPAVMLATGMANGGGESWGKFFENAYHGPRDDLSQDIDWSAGARFAEVNYRITRAMADSATPPLWYQGDYFGDTFAPKAARANR